MLEVSNNDTTIHISGVKNLRAANDFDSGIVKVLFVSGCLIEDFSFLSNMPHLEKLVFLDCKSEVWQTIPGNENVRILRLHTMREKSGYLENVDFIAKFPGVEYLYLNNFYIERFPDVSRLPLLHTVMCSGRKLIDYSVLEHAPNLKTYVGWAATDNHRTPAEAFIPILKNPSLQAFEYTQTSNVEEKKLDKYVRTHRPDITYPIDKIENGVLDNSKTGSIAKLFF